MSQTKGERPAHHANDTATSFQNPWPPKSLLASKQVFSQFPLALARRIEGTHIKTVEVVKPDFAKTVPDEGVIKATWLGHAVRSRDLVDTLCLHTISSPGLYGTIPESRRP